MYVPAFRKIKPVSLLRENANNENSFFLYFSLTGTLYTVVTNIDLKFGRGREVGDFVKMVDET